MTDIVDLLSAATSAFFAPLNAANLGKPVYHSLPLNQQPDFIHIAEVTSDADDGSKAEGLEFITVEIHTVVRGMNRQALHSLMHAQRIALSAQPLTAGGVRFDDLRLVKAVSPYPLDGVTRVGIAVYEVIGQPA